MQADRPKQYLPLNGKTILEHTIDALLNHPQVNEVVVAINPTDVYFDRLGLRDKPIRVVSGGNERADSVLNGIMPLNDDEWALVHDAARPCVSERDITALLGLINNNNVTGGILATPVRDTMKRVQRRKTGLQSSDTEIISHTEEREGLWHALTPQLFPAGLLKQALKNGIKQDLSITDEASAMELAGHTVAMISGSPTNIKVTHPDDLPLAEFYLQQKLKALSKTAPHQEAKSQCE